MADPSTSTAPILGLIAGDCWARCQLRWGIGYVLRRQFPIELECPRVRYRAGGGGFARARLRSYNGAGGLFWGPRFSPPVLTGTRLGKGWGRGPGQRTLQKHAPPGPFSGAGWEVALGAQVFRGPGRPVTNTKGSRVEDEGVRGGRLLITLCFSVNWPVY